MTALAKFLFSRNVAIAAPAHTQDGVGGNGTAPVRLCYCKCADTLRRQTHLRAFHKSKNLSLDHVPSHPSCANAGLMTPATRRHGDVAGYQPAERLNGQRHPVTSMRPAGYKRVVQMGIPVYLPAGG